MEKILTPSISPMEAGPTTWCYGLRGSPRFSTVTEAFYHHVKVQPQGLAAVDFSTHPPTKITYRELAQRSINLSERLRNLGVAPGDRVPLVVKRSIGMLVGILSILTCGAQYVPLDGGVVPEQTLKFVLEQTRGNVAVSSKTVEHRLNDKALSEVVLVDGDLSSKDLADEELIVRNKARAEGGCYVIYTSGTTGTPKGVDVTHQNVTNLICQSPGDLGITPGTRVGQVLNISFDMAAWETLGCLANGGTLILRGSNWQDALSEIDVLICTPSILSKYSPKDFPNIKVVATAGEPSSQRIADVWASHGTYYNCCGPTETTIVNTMSKHKPYEPLSIGTPTPNNKVYILGADLRPVGLGEIGVMWAGGLGLSRGYVGLPEKTMEKYIPDPFANDGSNIYNTGDLCRWNVDGSIDILGRQDDQVKVKGFRVELDGVTASLDSCPSVHRAATLLVEGEIHAFLTPLECQLDRVSQHVKTCQPYYAIPSKYHVLDSLPMTANGKIDKKKLASTALAPEPERAAINNTFSVPLQYPKPVKGHIRSESSVSDITQVSSTSDLSDATLVESEIDLEAALPEKNHRKPIRGLRHRLLIVYRRLFTLVGLCNIAAAIAFLCVGIRREWLGTITAANLAAAVLIRQDFVINALYTIACSIPKSWPLSIRSRCAKIYHLGGVHSGAAISAGLWLLANNIGDMVCMTTTCSNWGAQSMAAKLISWLLSMLFFVMFVLAWPSVRKSHHNVFEKGHRFVGWTMLGLFWAQIVLTNNDTRSENESLGSACLKSIPFWLLAVSTASVALSWVFLRKVPVEAEVLSDHAVRLHFDYTVPVNGSFTRLSHRPLLEWHSFATIPAPEPTKIRPKGYSLVVSNAGDWTKSTIQGAPTNIWVRGVPTCGVMRIATLFNRVVLIATGSGIGPVLGHIQNPTCATQLIWSTSRPEQTFGDELCNTIRDQIPNAVIHDTKKLGRPDLVKMGYNLVQSFQAEAVIIIANEKITKKVVYGLETRGIPAYGAIWDS